MSKLPRAGLPCRCKTLSRTRFGAPATVSTARSSQPHGNSITRPESAGSACVRDASRPRSRRLGRRRRGTEAVDSRRHLPAVPSRRQRGQAAPATRARAQLTLPGCSHRDDGCRVGLLEPSFVNRCGAEAVPLWPRDPESRPSLVSSPYTVGLPRDICPSHPLESNCSRTEPGVAAAKPWGRHRLSATTSPWANLMPSCTPCSGPSGARLHRAIDPAVRASAFSAFTGFVPPTAGGGREDVL